ncbi:MAG: DUF58 domain-containing protein [Flavobacteriaceae bacterium]|nr:DUF58 domain-containing protein [Flavobacteriaceae bacterium]
MNTKEILKKVRKIEIKTKRLSNHIFSGEYHSSFKGRGMTFSEVRQYQFGDDIRNIDWNVTARYNEPFVKVFEEERELTMLLMVDISASESFGTDEQFKRETITEIAATLAFSAIQNNDKVGLLLFTDQIELFMPPKKGKSHVLRIIRELIEFQPKSKKTNINKALEYLIGVVKKKAIIFILSDFIDNNYNQALRIIGRKHDVTGIRVYDKYEKELPKLGMIQVVDAETGKTILVDTNSKKVRNQYQANYLKIVDYYKTTFKKSGSGVIHARLGRDYVKELMNYFKRRS